MTIPIRRSMIGALSSSITIPDLQRDETAEKNTGNNDEENNNNSLNDDIEGLFRAFRASSGQDTLILGHDSVLNLELDSLAASLPGLPDGGNISLANLDLNDSSPFLTMDDDDDVMKGAQFDYSAMLPPPPSPYKTKGTIGRKASIPLSISVSPPGVVEVSESSTNTEDVKLAIEENPTIMKTKQSTAGLPVDKHAEEKEMNATNTNTNIDDRNLPANDASWAIDYDDETKQLNVSIVNIPECNHHQEGINSQFEQYSNDRVATTPMRGQINRTSSSNNHNYLAPPSRRHCKRHNSSNSTNKVVPLRAQCGQGSTRGLTRHSSMNKKTTNSSGGKTTTSTSTDLELAIQKRLRQFATIMSRSDETRRIIINPDVSAMNSSSETNDANSNRNHRRHPMHQKLQQQQQLLEQQQQKQQQQNCFNNQNQQQQQQSSFCMNDKNTNSNGGCMTKDQEMQFYYGNNSNNVSNFQMQQQHQQQHMQQQHQFNNNNNNIANCNINNNNNGAGYYNNNDIMNKNTTVQQQMSHYY